MEFQILHYVYPKSNVHEWNDIINKRLPKFSISTADKLWTMNIIVENIVITDHTMAF